MIPQYTCPLTMWSALLALLWVVGSTASCPPNLFAVYNLVLHAEWSAERFPKHYPEWRPPAQWSVVVGRTHNASYRLWQLGKTASDSVKQFIETGKADLLIRQGSQDKLGILSEFFAPPILSGVGRTEAKFFVDGNHSKVSFICRVIPSPDWFVGVDNVDLCVGNKWVDSVTLDLDPVDGGTDNGFTFTSPKWATDPRAQIIRISSRFPSHPANSFFYPEAKKLPRIAYVRLLKLKEYSLTQQLMRGSRDEKNDEKTITSSTEEDRTDEMRMTPLTVKVTEGQPPKSHQKKKKGDGNSLMNSLHPKTQDEDALKKMKKKMQREDKPIKIRGPRPCRVGEWSEWGACTKTCGFGDQTRERKIIKHSQRGGRPCPPLLENRWCGSARTCRNETNPYFRW